jgi:hypothetical protein
VAFTRSPFARCIALALMPAVMACSSWKVTPVAPRALVQESRPDAIRVTPLRKTSVILLDPIIRGDSVVGRLEPFGPRDTAVFLGDVVTVKTRQFDLFKTLRLTAATVGGLIVVAGLVLAIGTLIECGWDPCMQ